jgi:hypothetical protein
VLYTIATFSEPFKVKGLGEKFKDYPKQDFEIIF